MATRIVSALIALPLLIVLISFGGLTLKISTIIISLIGLAEFYKALSGKFKTIHIFGYLATIIYISYLNNSYFNIIAFKLDNKIYTIFFTLFVIILCIYLVIFHNKFNIIDVAITMFGFFYVPFLLSNIYIIREYEKGIYYVWLIFISAWACDTGAYFIGVFFGKNKLIPTLSPKKTIEGSIGGVVFATLLGFIYGLFISKVLPNAKDLDIVFGSSIICFFGSIFAQFGDFTASAIKRYTKIKDFGKIMPGHGGVIDRFDSVIFTAPIVYIVIILLS